MFIYSKKMKQDLKKDNLGREWSYIDFLICLNLSTSYFKVDTQRVFEIISDEETVCLLVLCQHSLESFEMRDLRKCFSKIRLWGLIHS